MTIRQFVKQLQEALNQQAVNKSLQLGKGQCTSMEDYKKVVGYVSGLEAAGSLAESMIRQMEDAARGEDDKLPEMGE